MTAAASLASNRASKESALNAFMPQSRRSRFGKFGVGIDFLHIVMFFQSLDQFIDRADGSRVRQRYGQGGQRRDFRRFTFDAFGFNLFVHGLKVSRFGQNFKSLRLGPEILRTRLE